MKTAKPPRIVLSVRDANALKKSPFPRARFLSHPVPFFLLLSLSLFSHTFVESRARAVTHLFFYRPAVFSASPIIKLASRCFSVCPSLFSHITGKKKKNTAVTLTSTSLFVLRNCPTLDFLICDRLRIATFA